MLILLGVTINVAINGGLITVTQEAKFKTEVRQIQEGLQVRKTVLLAENLGTLENISSITIDELDVDQKLKTKFAQKLIISKESDDFVFYYDSEKVTSQEKEWLEELGIYGELTFKQKVERIVASTPKIEGYADFDAIVEAVKMEHEDACMIYESVDFYQLIDSNSANYIDSLNKKIAAKRILKIIEDAELSEDTVIKTGTGNSSIDEIIDIVNQYELNFIEDCNVKDAKENIAAFYDLDYNLYIASDEGDLVIDIIGNVDYSSKITLMSETEAEGMFTLTENDVEDGITKLTINAYIGKEKNVKIPDVIYNENGNFTKVITEISSFDSPIKPFYEIFNMNLEEYNNITVAEIWNIVTKTTYEGENGAVTDNKTKYETLLPLLFNMGLTEKDVILKDDYIPYVYVVESTPVPMPENAIVVEIETITISRNVEEINAKAFLNQTSLTEIKYDIPKWKPTIASDAFEGCTNLTIIRFRGGEWPFYHKNLGTGAEDPIEGYETYWGAPNENVRIYDDKGEVEI